MKRRWTFLFALVVISAIFLMPNARALALQIVVDSFADPVESGKTTLRDAINRANLNPNPDSIIFDAAFFPGTIQVTSSSLPPLTGPGDTIDGTSGGIMSPGSVALDGSALVGDEAGLYLSASSLIVKGLEVVYFPGSGIVVETGNGNPVSYDGIKIIDNVVEGNGLDGISALGSSAGGAGGNSLMNLLIEGNRVNNHPRHGIFVSANGPGAPGGNTISVNIQNNDVSNINVWHGIHVRGGDGAGGNTLSATIDGNTVSDTGSNGIFVSGGWNGSGNNMVTVDSIDGNSSSSSRYNGIAVGGGDEGSVNNNVTIGTISDNSIGSNGHNGLDVWGCFGSDVNPSSGNTVTVGLIQGNVITGNGVRYGPDYATGISITGGVANSQSCAVVVSNLVGNSITDNHGTGIYGSAVWAGPWADVLDWDGNARGNVGIINLAQGNSISRNENDGILIHGVYDATGTSEGNYMSVVLRKNSITENLGDGISVLGGIVGAPRNTVVAAIEGNVSIGNGGNGIEVAGGFGGSDENQVVIASLNGNTSSANVWCGVLVQGGVSNSSGNRVVVQSISGNTAASNGMSGLMVGGAFGDAGNPSNSNAVMVERIENNTLTENNWMAPGDYASGLGVIGANGHGANNAVIVSSVSGNSITDNLTTGLFIGGAWGGSYPALEQVFSLDGDADNNLAWVRRAAGNSISRNAYGLRILGIYDNSGASSDYNLAIAVVENNTISDNTGYGVWLDDDYSPQPSPHIGNFVYADLGGGQGLIAGEPGSNGGNLIIGNGDGISPADIVNNIPADVIPMVFALHNTFDHQSSPDIDGLDIYDDDEDPLYGQVLFGGALP